MTDDRARLDMLFERVADLPAADRAAFVDAECPPGDALREELRCLVAGLSAEDVLERLRPGAPLPAGTHIGSYVLQERIGQGGMGEVYAAEQREPVVRRVAVKLVKPGMDSAQVHARFEAERQALALMTHPNVAHVLDGGATEEGRPYFVMEYVAGEPITTYCDRRQLETHDRLDLFLQVCEGVQHAHQKGLIHRDLKPGNILVSAQAGRAVPKIIDFGVARATTGRLVERTLHTMVGQVVGTLDYMSPEQADPTGVDVDTRSDVYSLGVVLYELLSGLLPFDHGRDVPFREIQRVILEQEPPTPSTRLRRSTGTATGIAPRHGTDARSLAHDLAGDLDWICLRALEKAPDRRYASAADLAADVRRYLAHEPVHARRPSAAYRTRKFVRRHRVGVTAGALVVGALVAGVAGVVAGRLEAEARAEELLRLSDGYRLRLLEREADEALWPAHPDRIDALLDARDRARQLVDALDVHRVTLADRTWDLTLPEERWQHELLTELVAGIESLAGIEHVEGVEEVSGGLLEAEAPSASYGWSLARRLREARELAARFSPGGDAAEAWQRALSPIRDAYPGLDLSPQMGLLPIGPDPGTGLWEFAHLLSGDPAERDPDTGRIVLREETGVVLVLLPGGTYRMGAQRTDPEAPNHDTRVIPADAFMEGPVHAVTVEPFFVSKYELTRDQWARFCGQRQGSLADLAHGPEGLLPAGNLSHNHARQVLHWMGLTLPDEEQWEYAARAGTGTPWASGSEMESLRGAANLGDAALITCNAALAPDEPLPWDDGHAVSAPVGSFLPNAFGLHDVHGNVGEYTFTHRNIYTEPRSPLADTWTVARGSNYMGNAYEARVSYRLNNNEANFRHIATGARPVRGIDPPATRGA